jgi:hypothetical protein
MGDVMRILKLAGIASATLLLGAAAAPEVATPPPPQFTVTSNIDPETAIHMAAGAEGAPVQGIFRMHVKSAGRQSGNVYLNSQADYRDQRNLTITLDQEAIEDLRAQFGQDPQEYLVDKDIVVRGEARRVQIFFMQDGQPTDKYYYQTHVLVMQAGQISLP